MRYSGKYGRTKSAAESEELIDERKVVMFNISRH